MYSIHENESDTLHLWHAPDCLRLKLVLYRPFLRPHLYARTSTTYQDWREGANRFAWAIERLHDTTDAGAKHYSCIL